MNVVFLNDFAELNIRYRSRFISYLRNSSIQVYSLGWFDRWWSFAFIFSLCFFRGFVFFSSNLRSNILSLLFLNRGLVILNGLGRYRGSVLFRRFLIFLVKYRSKRKFILVQNYADFRWLRFRTKSRNVFWCPGSGGVVRPHSLDDCFLVVSRPDKLCVQSKHIESFISVFKVPLNIVGVSPDYGELFHEPTVDICFCGYLPQEDIFKFGSRLFHPSGYGEGIPHVVVDAIVSGMEVVITKKQFVEFGFHRLSIVHSNFESYVICSAPKESISGLESEVIVSIYSGFLTKVFNGEMA